MLNTSLHNPSVKDKPAVEQFISMNRGINNGGDLPQELLVVSTSFSAGHVLKLSSVLSWYPVARCDGGLGGVCFASGALQSFFPQKITVSCEIITVVDTAV
jgi:hypothetical protein